jgi:glycosyltransferase involved in cell wall biosynthesis
MVFRVAERRRDLVMNHRQGTLNILVLAACTSHKGGLEVMCLQVAQEMRRRGHNIILAYREEGDAFRMFQEIVSASYKVRLGPAGLRNPFSTLRLLAQLASITRRHRIDVCFASNTGLARTTGLLHLITGVAIVYHFGVFYLKATDVLNRWGLRQSAIGIAPSSHVAETWLGGGLTSEQLQICPNWTNPDRFQHRTTQERLQLRRRLGIAPDIPLILYVGRLCAGKGVYTLISAVKLLNSSGVEPAVVLVGDLEPSERKEFHAALDCKLSSKLHIVGAVNNPEDYFAIADIAVVPALGPEAFGLTLIEAMSSEVVTVASRTDSIPEILGAENSDLLFGPGLAEECAQRLRRWLLADSAERAKRGQKLRQRALRHYSPSNAAFYEDAFYRAAEARRTRIMRSADHGFR